MLKRVYSFTYHTANNGEFLGSGTQVFGKIEDAMAALKEWKNDVLSWDELTSEEWNVGIDTETWFEACRVGDYCNNHAEGFISRHTINI